MSPIFLSPILQTSQDLSQSHKIKKNTSIPNVELCRDNILEKYQELTIAQIQKNGNILKLNPYSNTAIQKLTKNMINLQSDALSKKKIYSKMLQTQNPEQYMHKKSRNEKFSDKISDFIERAKGKSMNEKLFIKTRKNNTKVKYKSFVHKRNQALITQHLDQHQQIMNQYQQEKRFDNTIKKQTYCKLNHKFLQAFSKKKLMPQNKSIKQGKKLIQFIKPQKVTKQYKHIRLQSAPNLRINDKKNPTYKTDKYDIGVYSRSAKKAFYYYKTEPSQISLQDIEPKSNIVEKIYYKNYIQSYKSRQDLLRKAATLIY